MRRFLVVTCVALALVLLAATTTLAAPRIEPKGQSIDLGIELSPWTIGAMVDVNMPMSGDMSLRFTGTASYWWGGWFSADVSACVVYPVLNADPFKVALYGGPHVGYEGVYSYSGVYVGALLGAALEYKFNDQWTWYSEAAFGPSVGFWTGGTGFYATGGYGSYVLYDTGKMIYNAGVRSIGWNPGFFVGITF